ncbi:MAG: hypothetical protein IT318_15990 [Anaerolineales bacterium]|nr:hypothetical protein [Anaerolineales bacterium]
MQSSELLSFGLEPWVSFSRSAEGQLLLGLPRLPGVYVIRALTPISRFIGASDIAYIGSATNAQGLRKRIYQYFHPGSSQSTNHRILERVLPTNNFELAVVTCSDRAAAVGLEAALLAQYERDHGEMPPLNRRR